jgi:hypothetical protein
MILLEPILSKIPEKIHSPRRPPPRTAACLAEKFSLLFYFAPARFFLLKGKENFSASASAPKARGGGASLWLAGKNFLPPTLSIFARLFERPHGGQGDSFKKKEKKMSCYLFYFPNNNLTTVFRSSAVYCEFNGWENVTSFCFPFLSIMVYVCLPFIISP